MSESDIDIREDYSFTFDELSSASNARMVNPPIRSNNSTFGRPTSVRIQTITAQPVNPLPIFPAFTYHLPIIPGFQATVENNQSAPSTGAMPFLFQPNHVLGTINDALPPSQSTNTLNISSKKKQRNNNAKDDDFVYLFSVESSIRIDRKQLPVFTRKSVHNFKLYESQIDPTKAKVIHMQGLCGGKWCNLGTTFTVAESSTTVRAMFLPNTTLPEDLTFWEPKRVTRSCDRFGNSTVAASVEFLTSNNDVGRMNKREAEHKKKYSAFRMLAAYTIPPQVSTAFIVNAGNCKETLDSIEKKKHKVDESLPKRIRLGGEKLRHSIDYMITRHHGVPDEGTQQKIKKMYKSGLRETYVEQKIITHENKVEWKRKIKGIINDTINFLGDRSWSYFLATMTEDGQIVAFITMEEESPSSYYIGQVMVHSHWQRQGIGRQVKEEISKHVGAGVRVHGLVRKGNKRAERFYLSLGVQVALAFPIKQQYRPEEYIPLEWFT
jgi:GNAT superfamily N-acetyltransferase